MTVAILRKYVDSSFNVFNQIINHNNRLVMDFFGKKLEKLEKYFKIIY